MGDWIKENKFESGLLLAVLVVVIGAYLLGGKQGAKYEEAKQSYDSFVQTKSILESKAPYPTNENEKAFAAAVEDYRGVIESLQDRLLTFRPAELKQIAPSDFTDKLNAKREALAQRFTDAGIAFPDDKWHLGFERYTTTPPKDEATAYLSYQLDALDWLFGTVADTKLSALVNVFRPELPIESGIPMDGPADSKFRGNASAADQKPFHVLPLELTVRAPEPAIRNFLAKLAGNDQHFFVIRSMRVQNEKRSKPPKKDDVNFDSKKGAAPAAPGAFDPAFDLIIPGETPAPEGDTPAPVPAPEGDAPVPPVDPAAPVPPLEVPPDAEDEGERILGQVLGAEELFVCLQLELILFKEKEASGLPMADAR